MQKRISQVKVTPEKDRILARCLAEDLRNVYASGGRPVIINATTTETSPDTLGGRRDITNIGSDGDAT